MGQKINTAKLKEKIYRVLQVFFRQTTMVYYKIEPGFFRRSVLQKAIRKLVKEGKVEFTAKYIDRVNSSEEEFPCKIDLTISGRDSVLDIIIDNNYCSKIPIYFEKVLISKEQLNKICQHFGFKPLRDAINQWDNHGEITFGEQIINNKKIICKLILKINSTEDVYGNSVIAITIENTHFDFKDLHERLDNFIKSKQTSNIESANVQLLSITMLLYPADLKNI